MRPDGKEVLIWSNGSARKLEIAGGIGVGNNFRNRAVSLRLHGFLVLFTYETIFAILGVFFHARNALVWKLFLSSNKPIHCDWSYSLYKPGAINSVVLYNMTEDWQYRTAADTGCAYSIHVLITLRQLRSASCRLWWFSQLGYKLHARNGGSPGQPHATIPIHVCTLTLFGIIISYKRSVQYTEYQRKLSSKRAHHAMHYDTFALVRCCFVSVTDVCPVEIMVVITLPPPLTQVPEPKYTDNTLAARKRNKKAVLPQGNRAMQRVLHTPNDSSIVIYIARNSRSRFVSYSMTTIYKSRCECETINH